jgi:Tfp pilus assembly protein PilV
MLPNARPDLGETLIETLLAIMIVGIAVTAVLGGVAAASTLSGSHRDLTQGDLSLKQAAESLKAQPYSACGAYSPATCVTGYVLPTLAGGRTASFTVLCLPVIAQSNVNTSTAVLCNAVSDRGLQIVRVSLTGSPAETTEILKRQQ